MDIIIHLRSRKIDKCYDEAIREYTKRSSPFCKLNTVLYKKEAVPCLKKGSYTLYVIPGTNTISSVSLAEKINDICVSGHSCIEFVITEGLECTYCEDNIFNLSSFKMDNELCVVALTEQLYRAFTILNNITYHK